MLSLWGKLTKPSPNSVEADEKYYFSTDAGQVVSVDGSGYVIPAIADEAVEKADYIPLEFAQQKVKTLADESNRLREAYQKHLSELDVYYRQNMTDTKSHYEGVIKDLKAKALRHVEVRKQMQLQSEDRLNKELKQSEDSIDELRNNMASLNREYQEEVRTLKANIAESARISEGMRTEIATLKTDADKVEAKADARHHEDVTVRLTCVDALNTAMNKIEVAAMNEELTRLCGALRKVAELQRALLALETKNEQQQTELQTAAREREEAAAQQLRMTGEIEELHRQHAAALADLAESHAKQAEQAKQRYTKELRGLRARLVRAEVNSLLSDAVGQVVEEQSIDALRSLSNVHSASLLHHNHSEEEVVRRYEQQLQQQRDRYAEEVRALKKKFGSKLQVASDRLRKSEVSMCLKDLVLAVVERSAQSSAKEHVAAMATATATAEAAALAVPAKQSPRPSPRSVLATSAEHQALLQRVIELENEVTEQRRSFEEQLAAARQANAKQGKCSVHQSAY
jgi:DNA repair exonuclease SbcCD ATPase subunit